MPLGTAGALTLQYIAIVLSALGSIFAAACIPATAGNRWMWEECDADLHHECRWHDETAAAQRELSGTRKALSSISSNVSKLVRPTCSAYPKDLYCPKHVET